MTCYRYLYKHSSLFVKFDIFGDLHLININKMKIQKGQTRIILTRAAAIRVKETLTNIDESS